MYKIIDLFSGVGGLTFGFEYKIENNRFIKRNEFLSLIAIDFNESATKAFEQNFPNIPVLNEDIKKIDKHLLLNLVKNENVDVIVGGPPCQSFSMIGKRKNDDRSKLYEEYIRVLKTLKPRIFVFENVKGILTMKEEGTNSLILERIINEFQECGYKISFEVLNSANFGVPQLRERVFIVGVRNDIKNDFVFPQPTHKSTEFLNLSDAISDFPELNNGETKSHYVLPPQTRYQTLMRMNSDILTHHSNGLKSEIIVGIMNSLGAGESKIDINRKVDLGLLPESFKRKSGYSNTYGRLWWDRPGMTITNKINCPSSLRCVHPIQNRALTPREGARIQSFPDWFKFYGKVSEVMTQIGNAVPPILSIALADSIYCFLEKVSRDNNE